MAGLLVKEKQYTPETLLALPDGDRFELVDGKLVERNMGAESSWIGGQLFGRLLIYNLQARLGWVLPADASYRCFADDQTKVRRPDASFIRFGRLAKEELPKGHIELPPDLAVEVTSPHDAFWEVHAKIQEYQQAGVRLIWLVNPEGHSVEVFRADGSLSLLRDPQELDGEDVLPGFRCPLSEIFPPRPVAGEANE